jgi:hypothetical protein
MHLSLLMCGLILCCRLLCFDNASCRTRSYTSQNQLAMNLFTTFKDIVWEGRFVALGGPHDKPHLLMIFEHLFDDCNYLFDYV